LRISVEVIPDWDGHGILDARFILELEISPSMKSWFHTEVMEECAKSLLLETPSIRLLPLCLGQLERQF
jgi:hypothetical protein